MSDAAIAARRFAQLRESTAALGERLVTVSVMLGVLGVVAGSSIVIWAASSKVEWQFPAAVLGLVVAVMSIGGAMAGTLLGRLAQLLLDPR